MPHSPSHVFYEDDEYLIRPAENADEYKELWWKFMRELGWGRGWYDLDTYMNPSTASGMILLIHKANSQAVGHVSAVKNSNHTAWIAMFIIDEAHRGKGMGRELFKAALQDAQDHGVTVLGLDAVAQQKLTYERRRFVESPLGLVKIMTRPLIATTPLPEISKPQTQDVGSTIDIRDVPRHFLVQHEVKYSGFKRPSLWSDEHLFSRADVSGVALVARNPPQATEDLKGWCIVRRGLGGLRLGPLYADDTSSAEIVLRSTMSIATPGAVKATPQPHDPLNDLSDDEISRQAELMTEVWCGNPDAEKLFQDLGWNATYAFHRMWVDSKCPPEWETGGRAHKGVFSIFDAAIG